MLQKTSPVGSSRPLRDEALAWARLFDRRYIDRTLVGVVVMFFQREGRGTFIFSRLLKCYCLTEWSGINALIYYGPLLMRNLGLNGSTINLLVAGGINIVQFLAVIPAILYIDQWGEYACRFSVFSFNFLDRSKASAPWRKRCDDNISSPQCLIGMSVTYLINDQYLYS